MSATSPIMNVMIKAAEKAARSLRRDFGEVDNLQVSRKGPADFVTAADKRAEEIIFEELKYARPDYSFLMEESGETKGSDAENIWIVDPLDGTHNFMHGIPHWCISIALESKGKIEAGLVYDPIKEEMFRAERSGGAFLNRNRRLRVSGKKDMDGVSIAYGGPTQDASHLKRYLHEIGHISASSPLLRRMGAAALDLSYVAAGRLDGYWERGLKPWDVAAGSLIVKEAGGFVNSISNEENPVYSRNLVSGNEGVYTFLRKELKTIEKSQD
ncbi:MAG: inositol monophosphatase family protein [Pseudomonadota bacterium]